MNFTSFLPTNLHQTVYENKELIVDICLASVLPAFAAGSFFYIFLCVSDLYQKVQRCEKLIEELYDQEDSEYISDQEEDSEYISGQEDDQEDSEYISGQEEEDDSEVNKK